MLLVSLKYPHKVLRTEYIKVYEYYREKKKKDNIQIRATTNSGGVCGVPFTIAPPISVESQ